LARHPVESFFGDDELVWEDVPSRLRPAPAHVQQAAVAAPVFTPRPRRRQTRTLAGDLARIRRAARDSLVELPLSVLLLVLAVLVAAVVLLTVARSMGSAPEATPHAREKSGSAKQGPAVATLRRILKPGARGADVRGLQETLAVLGLYGQPPDGVYLGSTSSAVVAFQQSAGLTADAVVGPTTARALEARLVGRARTDVSAITSGLGAAVAAGRLSKGSAAGFAADVSQALTELDRLPPTRSGALAAVLHDIPPQAAVLDRPRALALFGMLRTNARYFAGRPQPPGRVDTRGEDGVVYRFFPSHGFQFHPLASFARLNQLAQHHRQAEARRLAGALIARAVPVRKALLWEYYFPFRGPARWSSGLAQAAGAQALARAGALLHDPALSARAGAAYRAIPQQLSEPLGGGAWVREYGFSDLAILNAQLQTIVSLTEYVALTHDQGAQSEVERLTAATRTLLPRFDTGCWSVYSLGGLKASTVYHRYHVWLLEKLAALTKDPFWTTFATRWNGYQQGSGCPPA
jgi:peptidoglycan hydrolase-like protein with peptidoglycan-binding domain